MLKLLTIQKKTVSLKTKKALLLLLAVLLCPMVIFAVDDAPYISSKKEKGSFPLVAGGKASAFFISGEDHTGVIRALRDLQADIGRVTNAKPEFFTDKILAGHEVVIAGTVGKSKLIDQLIRDKKIDVHDISGKWETFLIQVVEKPMKGVDRALVIVGSDKRGTIFGIYDVSEQIGVSPWYYWADVPAKHQDNLYVLPGVHTRGTPAVKYRGIFINDEQPALGGWVQKNFGGFKHGFYEKVFELILRMKGNYLWPAMWGQSFYTNDTLNPVLANEYGVVIGTSHHEPMMRAHAEWKDNGGGAWNYNTNDANLREFWKQGIRRMKNNESIVTLAMRGDGDEPMSEDDNVKLLEKIVKDQREILAQTTGKDVTTIPQVWALYKEVQGYYDKGMRVPDDVTLLLCDDNWGNIRKLPNLKESPRKGGYGIYYHYDYVGGPRNYKWLNTNPITKTWEQMHLAYEYGANQLWIVNVGDIKPVEFPTEFFLDYAWSPKKWPQDRLNEYTDLWAKREFGPEHSQAIAKIMEDYTKYNGRRKPELLAPDNFSPQLYSLVDYNEAAKVVSDYNKLADDADKIYQQLAPEYKDAYYQLILYPVKACANLNDLYYTVRLNRLYASQGRVSANDLAARAKILFDKDAEFSHYYNETMAGGKWNHMMDQLHIGYVGWHDTFGKNTLPEVKEVEPVTGPSMGVGMEGSEESWPSSQQEAVLPSFNPYQKLSHYFDIFNRGSSPVEFTIQVDAAWLQLDHLKGTVEKEQRIVVSVDWTKAPAGTQRVPVIVSDKNGARVTIQVELKNPAEPKPDNVKGFVETNGYVSIEAAHFTKAVEAPPITWQVLPDYGRTLSAITPFPVTSPSQQPGGNSAHVEYNVYFFAKGKIKVNTYLSPTINFKEGDGLHYGISLDNETPKVVNMDSQNTNHDWEESVKDNIKIFTSELIINEPGQHVLKFWMVDPGVVLQKIVIDTGGLKPSYLGPPESFYKK